MLGDLIARVQVIAAMDQRVNVMGGPTDRIRYALANPLRDGKSASSRIGSIA